MAGWLEIHGHTSEINVEAIVELLHGGITVLRPCCLFFPCVFFSSLSFFKNSSMYSC